MFTPLLCIDSNIQYFITMLLTNSFSHAVAISIVNYQFPQHTGGGIDANWLLIRVDATHATGSWTATDPCMLTSDIVRLADWFENIAHDREVKAYCSFLEPCLEFALIAGGTQPIVRVYFELEVRPSWAKATIAGLEDLWIDFLADKMQLIQAAEDLRQQLRLFLSR